MIRSLYRKSAFVLYQSSIALGIMLLPLAIVLRRVGYTLPIHHLIDRLEAASDPGRSTDG